MTSVPKLVCACPDARPGVQAIVAGLELHGILDCFATTFAYAEGGSLDARIRSAPRAIQNALRRRRLPEYLNGKVQLYPFRELARAAMSRWQADEIITDRVWFWAEQGFDRWVERRWAGRVPCIHGFEVASCKTFRTQKKAGGTTILGQVTAHHGTKLEIFEQELETYPREVTDYDRHLLRMAPQLNAIKDEQFALSDLIIANSEFVRSTCVQAGIPAGKIVVVANGAPSRREYHPELRIPNHAVFISAGLQAIHKGTPYLLKAWEMVKAGKQAELWAVGRWNLPDHMAAGLPANFKIMPPVPQSELFDLFQKASVLVLPSLYEGFAMVILEAMAHGLAVITTPNSGCGDFVEDGLNGWIVPIRDTRALADRMAWCIDHPDEVAEMGARSRQKAVQWSWDEFADSYGRTVKSFMGQSGLTGYKEPQCEFA